MRLLTRALILVAVAAAAGLGVARLATADDPNTTHLGKKIANLAFTDAAGKTSHLYDIKGKKAIVVVFLSFECPVAKSYMQPLSDMANEMEKQGIALIGLTTNQDETAAEVAKNAKEFKVSFPLFLDKNLAAANACAAQHTPEAFVLDGDFVLRYRGRIDDSYYARLKKNQQITKHDLRQVLGEMLAGKAVSTPATVAIGCPISRDAVTAAKTANVTYYKDVLPILQKNCQDCHRPGEVGPFSLMTYRQAVNWANDIKEYTTSRVMPPWKLSEGVQYHNERRLTDKEIATLAAWADNGTPEGNAKDAPPPMTFADGWKRGTPDLVLTMSEYQLGPTGNDLFRCFVLPTNLTEDQYVEAIDIRAGNARIVHHAVLSVDTKGRGRSMELQQQEKPVPSIHPQDKGPGFTSSMIIGAADGVSAAGGGSGLLGTWVPGQMPRVLPQGTGIKIPKGSDIIMQLHYHRDGRLEKDKTSVGLYFAKNKIEKPFQDGFLFAFFLAIPAGEERFVVKGTSTITKDMTLHDIMPHMHMLGKEIKVEMTPPDGQKSVLLHIKNWDYNWQETYFFKEPLKLKAGTRLDMEGVYDNSAKNPSNPFSPPRAVTLGEQTFNEMCIVILGGTSNEEGRRLPMSGFGLGNLLKKDNKK